VTPTIDVAAAILIRPDGDVLLAQRPPGKVYPGYWEFPGGKLEAGETPATGLRRELTEELSATFAVGELVETVRWEYPDRVVVLHFFDCRLESGAIVPTENQAMTWVPPEELPAYDFPPADQELIRRLGARG